MTQDIVQIQNAVKESLSLKKVLTKLNEKISSYNYNKLKKIIFENNIDISHFTGQAWNKGKKSEIERDLVDFFNNKKYILPYKLKNYMLAQEIKEHKCEKCNNIEWLNNKIPLELHHIDGDKFNNNLNNLQFLCPNCHASTDNYRGKKKLIHKKVEEYKSDEEFIEAIKISTNKRQALLKMGLKGCGANYTRIDKILIKNPDITFLKSKTIKEIEIKDQNWRKTPRPHKRKVIRPSKEELENLIKTTPMTTLGKQYGVSDNAVRSWCRRYGIKLEKRLGYWNKVAYGKI